MSPKYIHTSPTTMTNVKPPKYKKGEDLITWVRLYEKVAVMNEWTDKETIDKCPLYLCSDLRTWALYQTYTKWDDFAEALQDRYAKKQSIKRIADSIMSLRMQGKGASALRSYVTKFEKLVGKYHFACADAQLQQLHHQSGRRSSQAPVISLDEPSLISIFQQSLKPESLRYALAS